MYILELNKVPMYEFYYDYIKRRFGNKQVSLFTDADSFVILTVLVRTKKCLILVTFLLTHNIRKMQTH